jgi:hypothetical protein
MSFHNHACVVVLCDGCGEDWWNQGDEFPGAIHFATEADAVKCLTDDLKWRVDANQQRCPDCAAKQDCERNGHLLMSWQTCWCRNTASTANPVADPEPTCGHLWRQCAHCGGAYERRTFDTIPTV